MQPKFGVGDQVFYFSYGTGRILEVQPTPDSWTARWQYKIQFEKVSATLVENPRLILFEESGEDRKVYEEMPNAARYAQEKAKKLAAKQAAEQKMVKKASDAPKNDSVPAGYITIVEAIAQYPGYKAVDKSLVKAMREGNAKAVKLGRTWYFDPAEVESRLN